MSKEAIPLVVEDISGFSRALTQQLSWSQETPSHLALMNMLARAAGFRNFQHLRAAHTASKKFDHQPEPTLVDHKAVEKALARFDEDGRMISWPTKRKIQTLCLWTMWSELPAGTLMHERDVNGVLNLQHLFDDPALLRRSLFSEGMITRNTDGSDYARVEQAPPPEARALIRAVTQRRQKPPPPLPTKGRRRPPFD